MVRITKNTNIFKLIDNNDSTVDDFKKLYSIAPEKFKLLDDGYSIIEIATWNGRPDLVEYFKTLDIQIKYSDEFIINQMRLDPKHVKEFIKDINLKELKNDVKQELIDTVVLKTYNIEELLEKIYYVIENPKGGLDINSKYKNGEYGYVPVLFEFTKSDDIEKFKKLIEKYHPDFNLLKDSDGKTILNAAIKRRRINTAKVILENGLNINEKINGATYFKYLYISFESFNNGASNELLIKFIKLFIEHGLNIDTPINNNKYSYLMASIAEKRKEVFDFLIENGANVNHISTDLGTPLSLSVAVTDTHYLEKLVEKGADVNVPIKAEKYSILQFAVEYKRPLKIIKLLLDKGADKNYKDLKVKVSPLEIAQNNYDKDKEYFGEVIKLFGAELPKEKKWAGFSRSDIEKFDIFFEKPYDWSCCPICLEYVERSDGCMYMKHNCAITRHYYHKKLYNKYAYEPFVGAPKIVEWCTICGRITNQHKHYSLTSAQNPNLSMAALNPEIQARIDRGDNFAFFDNANCMGFGGGGTEEKAARFRRMREYALELQEDIDKKNHEEAMEELMEEVWNAPLVRNRKIKKILEDKRWNINIKEFPENKKNTVKNNNANAPNIPFNGVKPTIVDDDCIVMSEDDDKNTRETNPKFHFHHETVGGQNHNGIYICQKDLAKAIEIKCAEFGLENFGKCWFSPCKGILHPEELKNIIPEVLYNDYKKKFNKKMALKGGMAMKGGKRRTRKLMLKKQFGGNKQDVLYELDDGVCSPPNFTRDGKLRKF